MAALTKDRHTPELQEGGKLQSHPVAAATKIYAGSLVVLDAAGDAEPGSTALAKVAVGRAEEQVDNSAGLAGDVQVPVRRGVFRFANDAGDAIDRTHIGGTAYVLDDQTVSATDGGAAQSPAGKIVNVDAEGVWVEIS